MNSSKSCPRANPSARNLSQFLLMRGVIALAVATALIVGGYTALAAEKTNAELRQQANKSQKDGNFKDAYDVYTKLLFDAQSDPIAVSQDLRNAIQCLQRLGRVNEIDAMREKAIGIHANNWRFLQTAAETYQNVQHEGFIVAGEYERGGRRGGTGKFVNSFERDRIRALQLMQQAAEKAKEEKDKAQVAEFYFQFSDMLLDRRFGGGAWRMQYLSDLSKLPDVEEGYPAYYYRGGNDRGAPVDENGKPVFHALPKSWDEAKTDGERWRWCLLQAAEYSPAVANRARLVFANFLRNQFDVQTMLQGGFFRPNRNMRAASAATPGPIGDDDTRNDESGPYAVQTLKETETIARLANGIKRFDLPEEFNFIRIYQDLGELGGGEAETALNTLAQVFEDRQQYPRAAEYWKKSIDKFGPGNNNYKVARHDQIVKNWGEFDALQTVPAGTEPTLAFVFRNGKKVSFTAHELDVTKLLADVKAYLKGNPGGRLDWQNIQVENIGQRIVNLGQNQYKGKQVAQWAVDLKPRPKHFDKREFIKAPLKKAGAYLVTATMEDGNTTRIVVFVADTVLVKKATDDGSYFFVADAVTGSPIAKAKLDFFGWQQRNIGNDGRRFEVKTEVFAENADADGQVRLNKNEQSSNFQWLITATTEDGRLAYYGYTGLWSGRRYDQEYNETKVYTITDRPVYRPGHAVNFKTWINVAKYDLEGRSPFADRPYKVMIMDPRGEKFMEKDFRTDEYGGFDGQILMPSDATLGVYNYQIIDAANNHIGYSSFRVEEYKKPEFEVKVDAPTEPVMLGEKIAATITAKYYFGAPVTNAKVKYKVQRTDFTATWYPKARWDWFYGQGYWWFACDYLWYPGWREWGCMRPMPFWYPQRYTPPELVMENEVPVGPDGTVKVEIDTAVAKALHGDTDHKYEITAEVTDASRRTIVGTGNVSVARKPFKVYAWVDRGYYKTGDTIKSEFSAQTMDNKPVQGKGELKLYSVTYGPDRKPAEKEVQKWALDTNVEGSALQQITAAQPGQYRLSYTVTDAKGHAIEGGYVFIVRGEGFNGEQFRFNDVEIIADKKEYAPGDTLRLMVNTDRENGTVLLFVKPTNGIYLPPKVVRIDGKSTVADIDVIKKDMPNFFVEVLTVSNGRVHTEMREIVVPPENRVVNVQVLPSQSQYKPGENAKVQLKLTNDDGKPVVGSAVVTMYDKAVEYISGGSNVPDMKEFFWKWRRHHHPQTEHTANRGSGPLHLRNEKAFGYIGRFGHMVADLPVDGEELALGQQVEMQKGFGGGGAGGAFEGAPMPMAAAAPAMANGAARRGLALRDADGAHEFASRKDAAKGEDRSGGGGGGGEDVQPSVRSNFADTALWVASLTTNAQGVGEVELKMPENLTSWKTKVWTMSNGTRVGEGSAEVTTYKNLLVRLQAPRFFVQKDEVVLSANVHNYLKNEKTVKVKLDMPGSFLAPIGGDADLLRTVTIAANGEARVDWRVKVVNPGKATVRMSAITDEESDAMEMSFPVYIHGMLKTDSYSGGLRPDQTATSLTVNIPAERLPEQSRIEIRYSPSVAAAMVDALPYLVDYPYGCTEQSLNRFLPTVITQRVLLDMGLDLKDIQKKRTNLNAQEIGDDPKRAEDWKRNNPPNPGVTERNPVFDVEEVLKMTKAGVTRLANMQNEDGGWGWFSGFGERSWPHTTATVVHGLQIARENDVAIPAGVLERGIEWLKRYQVDQVMLISRAPAKAIPYKEHADDMDSFVFMVLTDAGIKGKDSQADAMRDYLYRDRNHLSVYTKAQYGLALHKLGNQKEQLDMILQNISQFVVKDDENQTAYLKLPEAIWRYYWYGTDTEAMGYYLKLLAKTDPKGDTAARLSKYIINNRKHASYWNSTRDTAICIEALADFIRASGEDKPDMTVSISIDGKKAKEVQINAANFFSFDNKLVLTGDAVTTGAHKIEFTKAGKGPLYFNAYVTNFTLEDPIKKAGLEIKVERQFYKLVPIDKKVKVSGSRGQALDQKVEAYERQKLADLATVKSGDLVEVEMVIESKNDYEYIMFEDMKASGFEPVEVRSGYNGNDLHAYMELRDERVCFFARALPRGKHSVAYRLRAEIPGKFSALPTKASAMYAPELKANSDEFKVQIEDAPALAPHAAPATKPAAAAAK